MSEKRVLIYGGCGALGRVCVDTFKSAGWWVLSVDLTTNAAADASVVVAPSDSLQQQAERVCDSVASALSGKKVDAILCVAGGFAMSNAAADGFIASCDNLLKQSVWTSIIAARLGALHLAEGGLLQLTGAVAAKKPTAALLGYGLTKAAVHQLTASLAAEGAGLPDNATVVAILPVTLDTPGNRAAMPDANTDTWTSLDEVACGLLKWASNKSARAYGGALVELHTTGGKTEWNATTYA